MLRDDYFNRYLQDYHRQNNEEIKFYWVVCGDIDNDRKSPTGSSVLA
jgi:hypothetical protein